MFIHLLPLPCGCVSEDAYRQAEVLECVWCSASFSFDDYADWLLEWGGGLILGRPPACLVKYEDELREVEQWVNGHPCLKIDEGTCVVVAADEIEFLRN